VPKPLNVGGLLNKAYGSKLFGAGLAKIREYCTGKIVVASEYIKPNEDILDLGF